jgi:hypothetical protein
MFPTQIWILCLCMTRLLNSWNHYPRDAANDGARVPRNGVPKSTPWPTTTSFPACVFFQYHIRREFAGFDAFHDLLRRPHPEVFQPAEFFLQYG